MIRRLIGVGVGPGDPDLMTLKSLSVLRSSDLILAPTTDLSEAGRAETIILSVCPDLSVTRILFEMTPGGAGIQGRRAAAERAAQSILSTGQPWQSAAFVTIGDPNVFSTFSLLAESVGGMDPEIEIQSVPGIMAFQDVVAKAGIKLLDEEESFRLLTGLNVGSDLETALSDPSSAVVIYKGGANLGRIKETAAITGRLESGWIGIKVGMSDSEVKTLADTDEDTVGYLSTLVFPPVAR